MAAQAAEDAAKKEYDEAKEGKVKDSDMRRLKREEERAKEDYDKFNKPIADLEEKIKEAEQKAAGSVSGKPSIKTADGKKDASGAWDGSEFTFAALVKTDADKKLELSFQITYYCNADNCKPIQCSRNFTLKVEEK